MTLGGCSYSDGRGRKLLQKSALAMVVPWTGQLRALVGTGSLMSAGVRDDRIY